MITTDTDWMIDGVSLQTMAYNIVTLGGGRSGVPPLRGNDLMVPYRPGQFTQSRIPDANVITLGMWVQASTVEGLPPEDPITLRNMFNRNWFKLRRLFWQPDTEFTVTKKFENENGDIVVCNGRGRYAGGLQLAHTGPYRANFTVDIMMADPFFYGAEEAAGFTAGQTRTLDVPGDWTTFKIVAEMAANGRLTNNSSHPPAWMQVTKASTVSVQDFSVVSPEAGLLTHAGAIQYFLLNPGVNVVTATQPCTLRYQPVYV
jgi:hypothetical protein